MSFDYLEEFFNLSSDLMMVLDARGAVIQANQSVITLLGVPASEVMGRSLAGFTFAEDRAQLEVALGKSASSSEPVQINVRCIARGSDPVRCSYTLRAGRDGKHYLVVGRNFDAWYQACNTMCREYQAMEQLIDARTHDLQKANAETESFSYSICHDLRAPLRAIRSFAMAIAEEHAEQLGESGCDYMNRILSNCERMTTLTDLLLQLARMSSQKLYRTTVDLGEMADVIMADLRVVAPDRHVSFTRKGAMVVEGDRELLFTLLQNLLDNAWKYTTKRPRAEIVFSSREIDGQRVFSVVDNGVGYPIALQERLFILFQRLHDHEEYEGLGIGLTTAQRIVQRHGGHIWAKCIEGETTAFHFTLAPAEKHSLALYTREE